MEYATTKELVAVGIKDPVIFELIGLFEEGVGADRISDMAISIIFNDIVKYTQRVAKELNIKFTEFKRRDETVVLLPMNPRNRKPITYLFPKIFFELYPLQTHGKTLTMWPIITKVCDLR